MSAPRAEAYFARTGPNRFVPSEHVGGAWNENELHFSPLAGLLTHAIEQHPRPAGLLLARISFDILGRLDVGSLEVEVETVRSGRTIELAEATLRLHGRAAVRARAWYLAAADTAAVAEPVRPLLPPPGELDRRPFDAVWGGGYVASLDFRPVAPPAPGRTTAWLASTVGLVADEEVSDVATYLALVDTANGIAVREDPARWLFPNVDLTIHLLRTPRAPWVGLDTTVTFGSTGLGVTSSVLHDVAGPVGRAEQSLTVRPRPAPSAP
ncbi:thioesterase family protein [Amnibacterium sp. CER49]|uniref:thioesterase family protein n=1 Tax=Amnibacterium sp. CER49 TaxID=3039161 RepID=UPI00244A5087|nr:thioesterase family protein [Amnibacterium sp. CER49]MDH2444036.1 thioesterase family protein [Amnibacterium sp. CER49]